MSDRLRSSDKGSAHGSTGATIWTRSRCEVDVTRPDKLAESGITVHDVAWALSGINRYNGHHPDTITVGAHSIRLMQVYSRQASLTMAQCRALLLHDAAEIVCSDLSSAAKWMMRSLTSEYDIWEDAWSEAFLRMFNADESVLNVELYLECHAQATKDEIFGWNGRLPDVYGWDRYRVAGYIGSILSVHHA